MDREELRSASVATATSCNSKGSWTVKLPLLCARPGNVGVQIDAHRMKDFFHRPRCGKFTAEFGGIVYENSSMENHARVLERRSRQAMIVEARLAKLKAYEQHLQESEQRRRQRCIEREAARQRSLWQQQQQMMKYEECEREEKAVIAIQSWIRGVIARRIILAERDARAKDHAARQVQASMKKLVLWKQETRRKQQLKELEEEQRLHAATIIQHYTRRRQVKGRKLSSLMEVETEAIDSKESCAAYHFEEEHEGGNEPTANHIETFIRASSLELFFSDDEDSPIKSVLVDTHKIDKMVMLPQCDEQRSIHRPKPPVSIKRVGGGYRSTPAAPQSIAQVQQLQRQTACRPSGDPSRHFVRRQSLPSSTQRASDTICTPRRRRRCSHDERQLPSIEGVNTNHGEIAAKSSEIYELERALHWQQHHKREAAEAEAEETALVAMVEAYASHVIDFSPSNLATV